MGILLLSLIRYYFKLFLNIIHRKLYIAFTLHKEVSKRYCIRRNNLRFRNHRNNGRISRRIFRLVSPAEVFLSKEALVTRTQLQLRTTVIQKK